MQVLIKGIGQGLNFENGELTHELIVETDGFISRIEVDEMTAARFVLLMRNGHPVAAPIPPAEEPVIERTVEDEFEEFGGETEAITFKMPKPFQPMKRMPGDPVPSRTIQKDEWGYPVTGLRPPPEEDEDDLDPGEEDFDQI